jgi:hypothetical protein
MMGRLGPFFVSCLLAFTAGHMFNYTVILYLQEAVGSDLLSGIGFGLAFGSSIVFGWFAGVVCDRMPPHRVIHAAQALFLAAWPACGGRRVVPAQKRGWPGCWAVLFWVAWPGRLSALRG